MVIRAPSAFRSIVVMTTLVSGMLTIARSINSDDQMETIVIVSVITIPLTSEIIMTEWVVPEPLTSEIIMVKSIVTKSTMSATASYDYYVASSSAMANSTVPYPTIPEVTMPSSNAIYPNSARPFRLGNRFIQGVCPFTLLLIQISGCLNNLC